MKTFFKVLFGVVFGCAALLCAMHTTEWFLVGRKVAAAEGIPVKEALPQCLMKGFLWWKPLKEKQEEE